MFTHIRRKMARKCVTGRDRRRNRVKGSKDGERYPEVKFNGESISFLSLRLTASNARLIRWPPRMQQGWNSKCTRSHRDLPQRERGPKKRPGLRSNNRPSALSLRWGGRFSSVRRTVQLTRVCAPYFNHLTNKVQNVYWFTPEYSTITCAAQFIESGCGRRNIDCARIFGTKIIIPCVSTNICDRD